MSSPAFDSAPTTSTPAPSAAPPSEDLGALTGGDMGEPGGNLPDPAAATAAFPHLAADAADTASPLG